MKHEEYHVQCSIVQWLRECRKDVLFTASTQGIRLTIQQGARFKKMGYLAGTSDIHIFEPRGQWHGLFVEVKSEKGRQSPEQKEFENAVINRGYVYAIVRSFDEGKEIIGDYLK